ncbi:MAG: hypothetical protein IPJ65_08905 [Archangiaceae bacterium]|nr:hypothetical protein [Archangiaceae bacterium]
MDIRSKRPPELTRRKTVAAAAAPPPPTVGTQPRRPAESSFWAVAPKKTFVPIPFDQLKPQKEGGDRDEQTAVEEADQILMGPAQQRDENGAVVTSDPTDVNAMQDHLPGDRHDAAAAQVEANQALEETRLAQLSPADRARYEAVKQRCLDANDPVAALALQKLLFEGKLPGPPDSKGEGTLLDHLAQLSDESTPLANGVNRDALVTDLVQELATPSSIDQGPRGTCAPTTIAVQLAMENPAEYARIAAGLASPEGKVVLAGGEVLRREDGTAGDDRSGRSQVQRLMAPSFMEMANGDENYDNSNDDGAGAWSDTLDHLYEQVMGKPMGDRRLYTDADRAEGMQIVDAELRAGNTVPVAMRWGDGGGYHKVLVTGTETIDGEEYVDYINPWGRQERMLRTDFEGRLADVSYDPWGRRMGEILIALDGATNSGGGGGGREQIDPSRLRRDDLRDSVRRGRTIAA